MRIDEFGEIKNYTGKTKNHRISQSQAELIIVKWVEKNDGCNSKKGVRSCFWAIHSADRGEY